MEDKVSKFGKIFTIVFNIVLFGLIIYAFYFISKFAFLSLAIILTFGGVLNSLNSTFNETMMIVNIIGILFLILSYVWIAVCSWGIFKKTNTEQTNALIPIYNVFCLVKEVMGSGWYILLLLSPIINFIFLFVFMYKLGKCFNKTTGYCILLMLFPTIMLPLLAYDNSKYEKQLISVNSKPEGDFQGPVRSENMGVLFLKWFLTIIFFLIGFLLLMIYNMSSNVMYLINGIFFIVYALLTCPSITSYTRKYKDYTKYKWIIVVVLLIMQFIVFWCYFSFR